MTEYTAANNPEFLLHPGKADAWTLLLLWYARKSAWWIFFGGVLFAVLIEPESVSDVQLRSLEDEWELLQTPAAGLAIAIAIRILANFFALIAALPAAREFRDQLDKPARAEGRIAAASDLFNVARAFRALRWTHSARHVAAERLGTAGRYLALMDPAISVANIAVPVVVVIAISAT